MNSKLLIFIGTVALLIFVNVLRGAYAERDRAYMNTPAGIQEGIANQIRECGLAAERGSIGPSCQAMPPRPVTYSKIYVPPPAWPTNSTNQGE